MADTQRTRQQILSLFQDNVTGDTSLQDLRDFVVTVMEQEFMGPGDFWADPSVRYTVTDKTARGWMVYSQTMGSACSFMNIMFLNTSNTWMRANVSDSTENGYLALAMNSYASDDSTATLLIRGTVYDSSFSGVFSGKIGRPVYLDSGVPGSISVGLTSNSNYLIGWILGSEGGDSNIGKWYFNPAPWAVKGE